ncbi:YtxH domain-containing protein [Flavobacterium undicola]|uniref:YtxH domain-containing protein n=1 Tax=Flavobacterium undicola TaxID=1932779 RepID=UPI001376C4BE|nr:YtxH domain-containing protein [Flavobacterium undicola]MBA0882253.1 YtxH domain-containing protein [Flavobacterium undicola]
MASSTGKTLIALASGAAIGAVLGILFAPDKGDKTRKKIKDGYKDLERDMKAKLANAKVDLEHTYEEMLSNMSYKTEDVITFLEKKLADLKEQNAKLHK